MVDNKKVLKAQVDGKEVEVAVKRPDNKARTAAQQVYNRAFRQAIDSGAIVRARIDAVMRDQNLWDDTRQASYEKLTKNLLANELKLKKGGIKLKEARELALQMRRDRWELRNLNGDRNQLDLHTAEALAENERFNFLVTACTVNNTDGKPYYKDVEDYISRENDSVGGEAALTLGKMMYGLDDNYEAKLPENSLLRKFNFVDDKLHLIDGQGRRIDAEGRLVDDKGRLLNDDGQLIDFDGNLLTEEGEYLVDSLPFLDDDGVPITKGDEVTEKANTERECAALAV